MAMIKPHMKIPAPNPAVEPASCILKAIPIPIPNIEQPIIIANDKIIRVNQASLIASRIIFFILASIKYFFCTY